jgi:hypothetical protein
MIPGKFKQGQRVQIRANGFHGNVTRQLRGEKYLVPSYELDVEGIGPIKPFLESELEAVKESEAEK